MTTGLRRLFTRRPHQHRPSGWDGFYEYCRCGACSGDRHDRSGFRCIRFDDWPEDAPPAP